MNFNDINEGVKTDAKENTLEVKLENTQILSWDKVWADPTFTLIYSATYVDDILPPIFNKFKFSKRWYEIDALSPLNSRLMLADGSAGPAMLVASFPTNGTENANMNSIKVSIKRPLNEVTAITIALGVRANYVLQGQQANRNAGALTLARVPNMIAYWNADVASRNLCSQPISRALVVANLTQIPGGTQIMANKMMDFENRIAIDAGLQANNFFAINYGLGQSYGVDWNEILTILIPLDKRQNAFIVDVSNTIPNAAFVVPNPIQPANPLTGSAILYFRNTTSEQDWSWGIFFSQLALYPADLGNPVGGGALITYPTYDFWSHVVSLHCMEPNTGYHTPNLLIATQEAALYRWLTVQYIAQAYSSSALSGNMVNGLVDKASLNFVNMRNHLNYNRTSWIPWEYAQLVNPSLELKDMRNISQWNAYLQHQVATEKGLWRSYAIPPGRLGRHCSQASPAWINDGYNLSNSWTYRPISLVTYNYDNQTGARTTEWQMTDIVQKMVNTPINGAGSELAHSWKTPTFL